VCQRAVRYGFLENLGAWVARAGFGNAGVRNQPHGRAFVIRQDCGERMLHGMFNCASCGRWLEKTAAWKGSGERYYCNDFCAEAEATGSPPLVPCMAEVSARIAVTTSHGDV
jgi:hypothetical protein